MELKKKAEKMVKKRGAVGLRIDEPNAVGVIIVRNSEAIEEYLEKHNVVGVEHEHSMEMVFELRDMANEAKEQAEKAISGTHGEGCDCDGELEDSAEEEWEPTNRFYQYLNEQPDVTDVMFAEEFVGTSRRELVATVKTMLVSQKNLTDAVAHVVEENDLKL